MAAKKRRKKKTGRRGRGKGGTNKSDFIRSMSNDMPAKDVVEAGKKKGLKFSQQLVYNVRAGEKKGGAKSRRGGRPARGRAAAAAGASGQEAQFRQLVVDLGVTRAKSLLDEVDDAMRRVVAGR